MFKVRVRAGAQPIWPNCTEPDTGGNLSWRCGYAQIANQPAQPLGKPLRLVCAGVGQYDHKLFAAQPRQKIRGSDCALECFCHRAQHGIAGRMAELVIDPFEMIKVDHNQ